MDQDQHQRRNQAEQAATAHAEPGEQQGQGPFLRELGQVLSQGVPEPGAVNPGPAPRPVRSGDFHGEHVQPAEQGEEH